ncbi:MAG: heterodisulfide reductase-related iron-sulfur binding cluster [Gemmatimonadota bacterium]|nr:heterodisulfide reductase-related iron-sulfur binding cluster [Gemmatimonadota bacterium]
MSSVPLADRPACALPDTPIVGAIPGIMTCVHCGFCLQACPTYLALEDENDSPRGRILIMRSLVEGELSVDDPSVHTHIDRCLGCQACETACPSGVPYGQMLEATRATLRQVRPIPLLGRMILWMFARPAVLVPALAIARLTRTTRVASLLARLPGRIGDAMAMLAASTPALRVRPYARRGRDNRGSVALLLGCVMDGLFRHTHRATERTLAANDYRIVPAAGQRCCGALHAHAGDLDVARSLARRNIDAFERSDAEFIAVDAAGCGAMMKSYGHLLVEDPEWAERAAALSARVRDVSELLATAGPAAGSPLPHRVTYDAPCHLLHAQRLSLPPLRVLAAIPGLDLVPLVDADQCCGAAGIYNLLEPGLSRLVLAPKVVNVASTGADLVATGNPGCHMQIGAGLLRAGHSTRAVHPVELLDASYAGHWM